MERILRRTYGVIVYQEQVIEVAAAVAGFSLAEADLLRRTMTHERSMEEMDAIGRNFVEKAMALGTSQEVADEVFRQLRGFAAYGFNKAHAACFAIVCNASAWLKRTTRPRSTAAAEQPAHGVLLAARGAQRRAALRARGAPARCQPERRVVRGGDDGAALRVGLAYVKEMSATARRAIVAARDGGRTGRCRTSWRAPASAARSPRTSRDSAPSTRSACAARSWWRRCRCSTPGPSRPGVRPPARTSRATGSTSPASPSTSSSGRSPSSPTGRAQRRVSIELELLGLNVSAHPLRFVRDEVEALRVTPMGRLPEVRHGRRVRVAGVLERAQMPWIRSGHRTMFLTLEDETELGQVVVFNDVYLKYGRVLKDAIYLLVDGELQNDEEHGLAVVAHRVTDLTRALGRDESLPAGAGRGGFAGGPPERPARRARHRPRHTRRRLQLPETGRLGAPGRRAAHAAGPDGVTPTPRGRRAARTTPIVRRWRPRSRPHRRPGREYRRRSPARPRRPGSRRGRRPSRCSR